MRSPALRRFRIIRAPRAPIAEEAHNRSFLILGPDRGIPPPGTARAAVLRRVVEGVGGLPGDHASPEAV
eukprot:9809585-Alexandrium_andersonii.AAC.1